MVVDELVDDELAREIRALRSSNSHISPKTGMFSWISQVLYDFSDSQILEKIGMDGYVTLRFLKMMTYLGGIVALSALAVLAPIYATADGSSNESDNTTVAGINLCTMANVPKNDNRLWASFTFHYLFTCTFVYYLYKEFENFTAKRQESMKRGSGNTACSSFSVMMENVPPQYSSTDKLAKLIEQNFPGQVRSVTVAIRCPKLGKLLEKRLGIVTSLENAIGTFVAKQQDPKTKGQRSTHRLGCCGLVGKKVDAIGHWESELAKVNELIEAKQVYVQRDRCLFVPHTYARELTHSST
jgi:lysine-specific demethylase 3